jgi:hypothetical protein
MRQIKKVFLLGLLLGLLGAIEGYSVGSACYQVNNTPCSPSGSTRTCYLTPTSKPTSCYCFNGRWSCPVEP